MGLDSGRSKQIIRESVLRQGILVRNCEGTEHCLKWKKKEDVSAGLTDTSAFGIYSYDYFRFALFLSLDSRIF